MNGKENTNLFYHYLNIGLWQKIKIRPRDRTRKAIRTGMIKMINHVPVTRSRIPSVSKNQEAVHSTKMKLLPVTEVTKENNKAMSALWMPIWTNYPVRT